MKKIAVFISCLILTAIVAFAEPTNYLRGSAVKTASALIYTGDALFGGFIVAMDGTNAVTIDVYDGTNSSGTKIIPQTVIPTSATNRSYSLSIDPGLHVYTGIYVVVSVAGGGSCAYTVYYK
jgi:hypothetical protein